MSNSDPLDRFVYLYLPLMSDSFVLVLTKVYIIFQLRGCVEVAVAARWIVEW